MPAIVTALKGASAHGGPAVFAAGLAMLAVAVTAPGRPPTVAAPRPGPTVTVTAPARRAPVAARTPGRPTPTPRPPTGAGTGVAATQVLPADQPSQSTGPGAPSGGSPPTEPAPTPSRSGAARCRGSLADAQALHALCVSIGAPR